MAVPFELLAAAWVSACRRNVLGIVLIGLLALRGDRFLTAIGRASQWSVNKLRRRSEPVQGLPKRLLEQRTRCRRGWQQLAAGAARRRRQMGVRLPHRLSSRLPPRAHTPTARWCSSPTQRRPFSGSSLPRARRARRGRGGPHRRRLVGVNGGMAVLATLAHRLFNYWLYLPAGLVGLLLYRRAVRPPQPAPSG